MSDDIDRIIAEELLDDDDSGVEETAPVNDETSGSTGVENIAHVLSAIGVKCTQCGRLLAVGEKRFDGVCARCHAQGLNAETRARRSVDRMNRYVVRSGGIVLAAAGVAYLLLLRVEDSPFTCMLPTTMVGALSLATCCVGLVFIPDCPHCGRRFCRTSTGRTTTRGEDSTRKHLEYVWECNGELAEDPHERWARGEFREEELRGLKHVSRGLVATIVAGIIAVATVAWVAFLPRWQAAGTGTWIAPPAVPVAAALCGALMATAEWMCLGVPHGSRPRTRINVIVCSQISVVAAVLTPVPTNVQWLVLAFLLGHALLFLDFLRVLAEWLRASVAVKTAQAGLVILLLGIAGLGIGTTVRSFYAVVLALVVSATCLQLHSVIRQLLVSGSFRD